MPAENEGGDREDAVSVEGGGERPMEEGPEGGTGVGETLLRTGSEEIEDSGDRRGTEEDGFEGSPDDAAEAAQEVAGANRDPARPGKRGRGYSLQDVGKALALAKREADAAGDNRVISRAAAMLGLNPDGLRLRVRQNEQLRILYSPQSSLDPIRTPTEADTMNRKPLGGLVEAPEPPQVDLVDMISECDRQFHELGLKKMGLSESLIKRIRNLESLAPNTGKFLSVSLENLSRSYYVQVMELMEVAKVNRDRLMAKDREPGYIAGEEARMWTNKVYIDQVKEAGRAYELFLHAAQAMVEMIVKTAASENGKPAGGKRKHGWVINDAAKATRMPPPD